MTLSQKAKYYLYAQKHKELRHFFEDLDSDIANIYLELRKTDSSTSAAAGGTISVSLNASQNFAAYDLVHVSQDKVATLADRTLGDGYEATHILLEVTGGGKGKAARKAEGVWRYVEYLSSGHQYLYLGVNGGVSNTRTTTIGEVDQRVGLFYLPADGNSYECWLFIEPHGV